MSMKFIFSRRYNIDKKEVRKLILPFEKNGRASCRLRETFIEPSNETY